jgi:hypothetical protein
MSRRRGLAKIGALLAGAALACGAAVSPAAGAGPNLIQNGGFELPLVGVGSYQLYGTGQSFPGWTVVGARGNVAPISGKYTSAGILFPAKAGRQWLDLTGLSNTNTGVSQTVTTAPGASYQLTFAVGNVVQPGGAYGTSTTVNVWVNGHLVLAAKNTQGGRTQSWKTFTLTVKATSAKTAIAFRNGDRHTDFSAGLDGVSLTRR